MYIPKNKIITNQYTNTKELVFKDTQEYYTGFYYKTFEGKYFTGKTPNNPPNQELIKVQDTAATYEPEILQSEIAYGDFPTIFDDINTPGYSSEMIQDYARLQNINLDNSIIRLFLPNQFYPKTNPEDYALGTFTRYFCIKVNQPIYLELSKETYNFLVNHDPKYLWEPYIPFKIQWTLIGDRKEVYNTNRNMVLLLEKRLKVIGLQRFLNENYLKFYK